MTPSPSGGRLASRQATLRARCSVFIATSLDGFIARSDGSIDWLDNANLAVPKGEDCGYSEFMGSIDALVLGRATFELALNFDSWPYERTPVYVLSRKLSALPAGTPGTVTLLSGTPNDVVAHAMSRGHRSLYVDGGETIRGFLSAGLITDLTITVIPVLLGSGRPLFGALASDIKLKHLHTRAFPFGFVQSKYAVTGDA